MVGRAHRLSSSKEAFSNAADCIELCTMFPKLRYPKEMVESTIHKFNRLQRHQEREIDSHDSAACTLNYLLKICVPPVESGKKLSEVLNVKYNKPPIVNT